MKKLSKEILDRDAERSFWRRRLVAGTDTERVNGRS
jgi:hypothetical protein